MRTPLMIGIAVAVGFALGWLLLARSPEPPLRVAPATHASASSAPTTPVPSTQSAPVAAAAPAESVTPPAFPAPSEAKPPMVQSAAESAESAAPAKTEEPADDQESAASASEENSDEPEPIDDAADESAIDVDHAADLLADWMAGQEVAGSDHSEVPQSVQALLKFDQEEADPEWSGPTAQKIEATLEEWLNALPDDVRSHVEIIHVECRLTLCQILAADNDTSSQNERAESSQSWQRAIETLPQQPWWSEFGFVDIVNAMNSDSASGYLLYQTYLRRDVPAQEQAE